MRAFLVAVVAAILLFGSVAHAVDATLHRGALNSGKWHGRLYTVPLELSCNALFYRADWLASAGVTPPKTLEELLSSARKLKADRHLRYGLVLHPQFLYNDVNPLL